MDSKHHRSMPKNLLAWFILLASQSGYADCVILLHGLARSESSMAVMEDRLSAEGYQTVNLGYPSRDHDIETLAPLAIAPALKQCTESHNINFVTHSLGGILVREYLSQNSINNLNRVVMLGPPNKGSEVVDKLHEVPGFYALNGDAGNQLGTLPSSKPNTLGPADFDLGIIAGTRSINLILSLLTPGSDDGKVSTENSKLEGMNDHIELPVTHTFMMKNQQVIHQVIHYLRNGKFQRALNQ